MPTDPISSELFLIKINNTNPMEDDPFKDPHRSVGAISICEAHSLVFLLLAYTTRKSLSTTTFSLYLRAATITARQTDARIRVFLPSAS